MSEPDPQRQAIEQVLREMKPGLHDEEKAGAVLVGWTTVCDWAFPDGERVLSRGWADGIARWQVDGMLHHVLFNRVWQEGDDAEG